MCRFLKQFLKQYWLTLLFVIISFYCGYTTVITTDFAQRITWLTFTLLCLVLTQISRFKQFKGFGIEAELWNDTQEEAAAVLKTLNTLQEETILFQLKLMAIVGRWGGSVSLKEQWATLQKATKTNDIQIARDYFRTILLRNISSLYLETLCSFIGKVQDEANREINIREEKSRKGFSLSSNHDERLSELKTILTNITTIQSIIQTISVPLPDVVTFKAEVFRIKAQELIEKWDSLYKNIRNNLELPLFNLRNSEDILHSNEEFISLTEDEKRQWKREKEEVLQKITEGLTILKQFLATGEFEHTSWFERLLEKGW